MFCMQNFVFASTFAQMLVAGFPDAESGGNIATLLLTMSLTLNGVMQPPRALPGFWIFLYRVSPLTYLVSGIVSTALHGREINYTSAESYTFDPPTGHTCADYLATYLETAPGRLANPAATAACQYCPVRDADSFLAGNNVFWSERWRNFGIVFVFIGFNVFAAIALYWLLRMRSLRKTSKVGFGDKVKAWIEAAGGGLRPILVRRAGESKKGKEAQTYRAF